MKKLLLYFSILLLISSCNQEKINKQNTEKVVMLVYGHPACGKLTTANEVAKKYNLNLIDNHFFNNILFPFVELNTKNVISMYPEITKIKKIWFDNIIRYGKKDKGFIFTDVLIDLPSTRESIKDIMEFSKKMNYKFLPIKLVCDEVDIKDRIKTFERKKRHKIVDFQEWKKYIETTKFVDIPKSVVIKNKNLNETLELVNKALRDFNK